MGTMLLYRNIVLSFFRKYPYFCDIKAQNVAIYKQLIININALKI
jgi:hypothetical protein